MSEFRPIELQCEQLDRPVGVSLAVPRFSWKLPGSAAKGTYRLRVATSQEKLAAPDMWDSGEADGLTGCLVPYAGDRLLPFKRYYWSVTVSAGGQQTTESSYFTTGVTADEPWKAPFLGAQFSDYKNGRALYFRRNITVKQGLVRAIALVCGLGYNELYINGEKQGDAVMEPGWTDYKKRAQYVSFDITDAVKEGENGVGIIIGEGWYGNDHEAFYHFGFGQLSWHGDPRFSCEIHFEYQDGEELLLSENDGSWKCGSGPITYNNVFNGEHYDARLEVPEWAMPEGKELKWNGVNLSAAPCAVIEPEMAEPIKVIRDITPVRVTHPTPDVQVFDMGQNFAGWAKITASAPRGASVRMRFAESLYDDGTVNQENLRWATNEDIYIFKGEGEETYEPRFTYHGFRYVQVEGLRNVTNIVGRVVRSSVKMISDFACDSEIINKIQKCVLWTEESNLHSVPTDCPQRDERQGWVNDCTVRMEEIIYNFGVGAFLRKWHRDLADTQEEDGAIKDVAPRVYGSTKADALSSVFLFAPWLNYMFNGDIRTLAEQYDNLCRWEAYITGRSHFGIVEYSYYGDWAGPVAGCVGGEAENSAVSDITPGCFISTVFYYENARLLSQIAGIIGRTEDVGKYSQLADYIRSSINREYFNPQTAQYAKGSQATNLMALHFDIVPAEYREKVLGNLIDDIKAHDYHLTTGNIATKYLFEVLSDNGCIDVAYEIASKQDYPSWGYMIAKGATTVWERWELGVTAAMNSHNHPMYCTISTWFHKHLAGISPAEPGFRKVRLAPKFPKKLGSVRDCLNTAAGDVSVSWNRRGKNITMEIELPSSVTATLIVPVGYDFASASGGVKLGEGGLLFVPQGHSSITLITA